MGTAKSKPDPWRINFKKFKVYLKEKYKVTNFYYFLGYYDKAYLNIYEDIESSGFEIIFREHNSAMIGKKKGNVDSDIIFEIMKKIYIKELTGKVILVSGDGDYIKLVRFLIKEDKFKKILFPNQKFKSSLYNELSNFYFANLDSINIKSKIKI